MNAPDSGAEAALDTVRFLLGAPVRIVTVLVLAVLARWLLHRGINRFVERAAGSAVHERLQPAGAGRVLVEASGSLLAERRRQRMHTIGSILRSLASITVVVVALATVLGELGVNLGPLLASAGIAGAALGFGAQSLVRDFLTGIFLMLEDQYGVGDSVDLGPGSVAGTVEAVGLRVTRLRDENGAVWYVRNGEIVRVGNRSQGWSRAAVDVPVPADEDLDRAREAVAAVAAAMAQDERWEGLLLEPPEIAGVEAFGADTVTLRVTARCAAGEQLAVERELRRRILAQRLPRT